MARYKHIDTRPRFLVVDLQRQLIPGFVMPQFPRGQMKPFVHPTRLRTI